MKNKFLIIEGCNFIDRPIGGQLSFAKQLIDVYGDTISLVGVTSDPDMEIGKWNFLIINGVKIDFFPFKRLPNHTNKSFIPARISDYLAIRKYKKEIISKNRNAITQAPEILIAINNWKWNSLCYEFPGVENPLEMPRFKWGKYFSNMYEKKLFKVLKNKVDVILASAGKEAILSMVARSNGLIQKESVFQFPTRVDTTFFKPIQISKIELNISDDTIVLISCGRINKVKGWELIIDAFNILNKKDQSYKLFFIGDGEDRNKLEEKIGSYKLNKFVTIVGFQTTLEVLKWTNIADIVLVGSYKEGWSISMLEALACGKPIVSTNVSGAKEMIKDEENGYIVNSRNPQEYANKIEKCITLDNPKNISLEIAKQYSLENLKHDLDTLWRRK